MSETRFARKVAIVTGAGRGVGQAVAEDLAAEGASLVLVDVRGPQVQTVAEGIAAGGGSVLTITADISRSAEVNEMVRRAVDHFGTVDFLVNNAGILQMKQPLETISDEEWARMFAVNLNGAFYCTRAVLPILKAKRSGRIVNVSSSAGRSTSANGGAHYTASKAAILGLTRHTAREVASFGITVNVVAPASLNTDMALEAVGAEHLARSQALIPVGRLGMPEDVAAAILFLLSDAASFITGATLDINGGLLMI
jgi:NAD(P)-dependent dehydrogenase (short-subunit alcohol dehydrogenase family)